MADNGLAQLIGEPMPPVDPRWLKRFMRDLMAELRAHQQRKTVMDEQIRERHPLEVRCRSCGLPVVWFRTAAGKRMPVDAKTTRPNDAEHQLDLKRHVSHFSTCPQAGEWRKPR